MESNMEIAIIIYLAIGLALSVTITTVFEPADGMGIFPVIIIWLLCIIVTLFFWLPMHIWYYGFYNRSEK